MRKTRSDAVLLNLPEERQAQLADWLLSGVPYHQARALVQKEWGITVSLQAFSEFWQAVCGPALLAKRARAARTADAVADEAQKDPGRFDAATVDALKQRAFELAISPGADPDAVKSLFTLVLKARDQDLEERRVKLLEAKAAQADEAEKVMAAPMSEAERAAKMREIFGLPAASGGEAGGTGGGPAVGKKGTNGTDGTEGEEKRRDAASTMEVAR